MLVLKLNHVSEREHRWYVVSFHHTRNSLYHTRNSFHHTRNSLYHTRNSFHHTRNSLYHTRNSFHHTRNSLYHTRNSFHHTRNSLYHTRNSLHHTRNSLHHTRNTTLVNHLHVYERHLVMLLFIISKCWWQWQLSLTHLLLVLHICVSKLCQHWLLYGCSVPSHPPNQCWLIVNWTIRHKLLWTSIK